MHLLALVTLVAAVALAGGTPTPPDDFLVRPYLQFGTDTSMVVLWETDAPATTLVRYGRSRLGDTAPNLGRTAAFEGERTMHEVVLEGLTPDTKYFWQAVSVTASGDTLRGDVSTFRTNVGPASAFAFVLYGDTQDNPDVWGRLATLGWLERPHFALHAGDLVDAGGHKEDWTVDFFPPGEALMQRVPMYTALGNHEDDDDNYYAYFHNPAPEYYYTFRYGNAQFFIVDTNRDVSEGSEQWDWLEWELAASDATWKFVVHHHPPYSSEENDHGDTATGETTYGTHARDLVPLYEAYGVDFNLFGHVHMYERTWPILRGRVVEDGGVVYINSGGGGGGLEQFAPTRSWFSAKVRSVHHYGYFAINGGTVQFQAIDEDGRLFDSFEMTKDGGPAAMRPPAPRVRPQGALFLDDVEVTMAAPSDALAVHYTTDGSEPTAASPRYTGPLRLDATTTVRSVTVAPGGEVSRVREDTFTRGTPRPPTRVPTSGQGWAVRAYHGAWAALPDFDALAPVSRGTSDTIGLSAAPRAEDYGLVFEGVVDAPETGVYTLSLTSDDGSALTLGDERLIDNDGLHGSRTVSASVALGAGPHAVRVDFFQGQGGHDLSLEVEGPRGGGPRPIPVEAVRRR